MIASGLNIKTVEVLEDIQVNMSLDEAYALLMCPLGTETVAYQKLRKVLHNALLKYEDEIKPQTVCKAA